MSGELIMLNSEIPSVNSGKTPFYNKRLSDSYIHFYQLANTGRERMYFASAEDFLSEGAVRGHWVPKDGTWVPVQEKVELDLLFDKLGGDNPLFRRTIAQVMALKIPIFGHYGLNQFTGDKWNCYEVFSQEHALTRLIDPNRDTIEQQLDGFFDLMDEVYAQHDNVAVIKPRWGWESRGLYLLQRQGKNLSVHSLSGHTITDPRHLMHILDELVAVPYIIQAYVNVAEGIPELNLKTDRHDARFVFSITEPGTAQYVQAYVKTPHGMFYYPLEAFPPAAFNLLETVADKIAQMFPYGIFSVDIMRDVSGRWFLTELNDQIGFNIDFDSPRDVRGVTDLMRRYLAELYTMRAYRLQPRYQSAV